MEPKSVVLSTTVEFEGESHKAHYFVEDNMIYATIGARVLMAPLVDRTAESVVKSLLSGHLQQQSRKLRHRDAWSAASDSKTS